MTSKHGKVKDDYGEYKYIRLTYHRYTYINNSNNMIDNKGVLVIYH